MHIALSEDSEGEIELRNEENCMQNAKSLIPFAVGKRPVVIEQRYRRVGVAAPGSWPGPGLAAAGSGAIVEHEEAGERS